MNKWSGWGDWFVWEVWKSRKRNAGLSHTWYIPILALKCRKGKWGWRDWIMRERGGGGALSSYPQSSERCMRKSLSNPIHAKFAPPIIIQHPYQHFIVLVNCVMMGLGRWFVIHHYTAYQISMTPTISSSQSPSSFGKFYKETIHTSLCAFGYGCWHWIPF